MVLYILVGQHNVVGCLLLFIYMRTPPTYFDLESSGRAIYMETQPEPAFPRIQNMQLVQDG